MLLGRTWITSGNLHMFARHRYQRFFFAFSGAADYIPSVVVIGLVLCYIMWMLFFICLR